MARAAWIQHERIGETVDRRLAAGAEGMRCVLTGVGLSLVIIAGAGCGGGDDPAQDEPAATAAATTEATETGKTLTIELLEENQSGQTGTATLTDVGVSGTAVVLEVSPPKRFPGDVQIGSINAAPCAEVRKLTTVEARDQTVRKVLTEVREGRSETTSASSLAELKTGTHSINVYQEGHPFLPVLCGDIPGE